MRCTCTTVSDLQLLYPNSHKLFKKLKWEFWVVNFLILAHVIIVGYTDPLDYDSNVVQIMMVR